MAIKLKTHSHLMAKLGAIKANTISHWAFSAFPQAPAQVVNCTCMIVHTWNHVTALQKSSNPHMALVDVSHRPTSVERSEKSLMLSLSAMEGKRTS